MFALLLLFNTGLGTLCTLEQYGEVTGLSHTHEWYSEGVPSTLPLPPIGEEDMTGSLARKAEWLMELVMLVLCVIID